MYAIHSFIYILSIFTFKTLIRGQNVTSPSTTATTTTQQSACTVLQDCEKCVANSNCFFCSTNNSCQLFTSTTAITGSCPNDSIYQRTCSVTLKIIIVVCSVVAVVIIISAIVLFYCCCCRKRHECPVWCRWICCCCEWCPWNSWRSNANRDNSRFEMEQQARAERYAERQAEMQTRHEEIRRKYGLMKSVSGAVTDVASAERADAMSSGSVDRYHRFENQQV
jgi:hypothetical protein